MSRKTLFAMISILFFLGGCGKPSSVFDCSGDGEARGKFSDGNSGELTFKQGSVWGDAEQGYRVVFSNDAVFVDLMRASVDPRAESARLAQLLGILVMGYDFDPSGNYRQYFTQGISTSSGYSGADEGKISIDAKGCARGDVYLQYQGSGFFALPLTTPTSTQDLEVGGRPAGDRGASGEAPLQQYADAYARLNDRHPVVPFEVLGYSNSVATLLSNDARAMAALQRIRTQCPNPATTRLNEYAEVVGTAEPFPGVVLSGTVYTSSQVRGPVLDNCYVMQRNGEYIDQCWPLTTDCTTTPLYKAD